MQHTLVFGLLPALLALSLLSTRADARSLPPPEELPLPIEQKMVEPSTSGIDDPTDAIATRVNSTSSTGIQEESRPNLVAGETTEGAPAVKHIRVKREWFVDTPYDFHTTHLFCDLDERGRHTIIWFFPNHCIWIWNNKYLHEGFYRLYKLYQLEAFFFGQWRTRLFQHELEKKKYHAIT